MGGRRGAAMKRQEGTFGDDGNVVHHDHGGVHMTVYICQNNKLYAKILGGVYYI